MKTVLDKQTVAHYFAHQTQDEGRTSTNNFKFNGRELVSYGTTIAYHFGEFILITDNGFSVTTRKQLSIAARAARHLRLISSGIFSYGNRFYSEPSSKLIISDLEEQLTRRYADILNPRIRATTKATIAADIRHTADNINYIIKHFGIKRPPITVSSDIDTLIADSAVIIERITAERAAAEQAARRKNAVRLKKWLNGDTSVYLPYAVQSINGSHLLTIRNGEVFTSMGATAPLLHVIKALDFYNSRTDDGTVFKPWHSNGHKIPLGVFTLDSIDEHGTVKAGCHTFTASEIARFANRWADVIATTRKAEQANIEALYNELN